MKWICTICSYVHEGDAPPGVCPVCNAGRDAFVPAGGDEEPRRRGRAGDAPETLEQVRDAARDALAGICAVYPWCDGAPGNICNREAYGHPIRMGGAGTGSSFAANVESLARLKLETRVVGEHFEPDTSFEFLGERLSMPVMASSTSGIASYGAVDEEAFNRAVVDGCMQAGTIGWRGDTHDYDPGKHGGLDAISRGKGVQIFKPRAQDVLARLIESAEEAGCLAVGVDLDGFGSTNFARAGKPLYRKSKADIRALVEGTGLPFVAKGVMCVADAEACVEAGARVVAVSNHGGRVVDGTPGVADVLHDIASAVGGDAVVTADGGVRTGWDVLRMLALGARAVLLGRDVIRAAIGGGAAGVRMQMQRVQVTLARAMLMTGCETVAGIGPHVLGRRHVGG